MGGEVYCDILLLLALQANALKVGELEGVLSDSLSRNQIKYLLQKLIEDKVVKVEGQYRVARYSIADKNVDLKGDALIDKVIAELRDKYE